MTIPRAKFHRATFVTAGVYNIGWGIYSIIDPQWLFRFADMPLQNYPQIFACLGMVVGLYGFLYFETARNLQGSWPIAVVGLTGKVLGPIGLFQLILSGAWPKATVIMCLTNDLVWWIPFGWYLYDAWPAFRVKVRVVTISHAPASQLHNPRLVLADAGGGDGRGVVAGPSTVINLGRIRW